MSNSFGEFEKASMFVVIGSNMTEAHPVAATFLKNAVSRGAKLVVIDPRRHKLAELADVHLQIKSGADVALLNAIMHVLVRDNLNDQDFVNNHCENFAELHDTLGSYAPDKVTETTGISVDAIEKVAHLVAKHGPAMICYTLGITEHVTGTDNVLSVANLQMLLGGMGKPSAGVNPLRGQNNVQGASDMAASPNVFPGYVKVTNNDARERFAKFWNISDLPAHEGLKMPEMFHGLPEGKVRGLWIFGENVAGTEPDIAKIEHELSSAEFLVVQDIFPTETTRFADVILPAKAWGEKDGTFTNSERRVSRVRAASPAPGEAKDDWWIFREIAKRLGHHWQAESAKEIWDDEISQLVPDLFGIKYARIDHDGLQWPCPDIDHAGTVYLHKDGNFARGKGLFSAIEWRPPAEVVDAEYPLVLSTGRRLYHYHTRTQTGHSKGLNDLMSEELVDISPQDAEELAITDGAWVKVSSRRGYVTLRARVTESVPRGMVWMTFHFRQSSANWLTNNAFDPVTMTAEYKVSAVRVEPYSDVIAVAGE